MNFKQFFPIADWLPRYRKDQLGGDISAGITVGVMLIPQGMAYALIAGLPPVYGLYAAIVPQLIYVIFGTSRQLAVGPVAMDSLLVASGVGLMATEGTDTYIALAILLAGTMGLIQLVLGLAKMGFVTNLLSKPVISGFTSAAAIIIGLNQLKYLMGVELEKSSKVFTILWSAIQSMGSIHWITLALGVGGIAIIKLSKKLHKSIPGALVAVIIGIVLVYVFRLDLEGVKIVKEIPEGLPSFSLHDFTFEQWLELLPLAVTIAVVAFMESYSVSKSLEAKARTYKVGANQELVALGMSNFIGAFFQSYPVTGGFSRSAVNYQSGANTPLTSIFSAAIVGFTLLFLTPLFYYLPHAILAAVIMVAVSTLIDIKYAISLLKFSKWEFVLLLVTFITTLNFSMVPGIVTGIVLSILTLLFKLGYPHIAELGRLKGHHEFRNVKRFKNLETWDDLLIIRLDAPLTFINIQYFKEYVETRLTESKTAISKVIIDASAISYLDASATQGLRDMLEFFNDQQIELLICDVKGPARDMMKRTQLDELISHEHIFLDLDTAVRYATDHEEPSFKEVTLQTNES
ncbi:MAG: sodium-independent anion transporter [Rickettsiales bacterium]|nr:sodium-independent anion transporter [Rickettsiales bacterium]